MHDPALYTTIFRTRGTDPPRRRPAGTERATPDGATRRPERETHSTSQNRGVTPVVVMVAAGSVATFSGLVEEAKDTNEKSISVSDNLLANDGFEDGAEDWALFHTASVGSTDPYEGSRALEVPGRAYAAQSVTDDVEPGADFRLCARSKLTDPNGEASVGVQFYDDPRSVRRRSLHRRDGTVGRRVERLPRELCLHRVREHDAASERRGVGLPRRRREHRDGVRGRPVPRACPVPRRPRRRPPRVTTGATSRVARRRSAR